MEGRLDERITDWMDELQTRFVEPRKTFDFAPWTTYLAYDVISEMSFGRPMGFTKAGIDLFGLIKGFHDQQPIAGLMVRLHPFFNWLSKTGLAEKLLLPKPTDKSGYGRLMNARDRIMAEFEAGFREKRGSNRDKGQAFLEFFYNEEIGTKETGRLTKDAIKSEALLLLIVGSDTTSTAMQALLIGILTAPQIYDKVMRELDALPAGQIAQHDVIQKSCPYYLACVKEAIRLVPSAPTYFPRHPPPEGIELFGKYIPPVAEVAANPYFTQRDPKLYGEEGDAFRPERWLEDPVRAAAMDKYEFTFGYGSRMCLGKSLAMMELYKSPVEFLREFKITPLNRESPARLVYKGGVFWHEDFNITIEKRQ
ncbi:hypothetical protein AJ79_05120 [Helicocarpus griseus UAMH5409]|uniref:Cytochrome P450 monooxygenase n=1 Tax=Helicocarpus griseus UAMH5409 TaxID=1447875 RepID=A0A2B7XR40_9EURO|nr:hypothetical protein AJ79_05120 [Helicocarpus griseus UAMH5409]